MKKNTYNVMCNTPQTQKFDCGAQVGPAHPPTHSLAHPPAHSQDNLSRFGGACCALPPELQ